MEVYMQGPWPQVFHKVYLKYHVKRITVDSLKIYEKIFKIIHVVNTYGEKKKKRNV